MGRYVHAYECVCICVYMCVCVYVYVCVYVCVLMLDMQLVSLSEVNLYNVMFMYGTRDLTDIDAPRAIASPRMVL